MAISFGGSHHSTHYSGILGAQGWNSIFTVSWHLRGFWQLRPAGWGVRSEGQPASCLSPLPTARQKAEGRAAHSWREGGLSAKVSPALGRQQLPASLSSSSETNEPANSTPSTGMTKPEGDLGQSNYFLLHAGTERTQQREPGGDPTGGVRRSSRTQDRTSQCISHEPQRHHLFFPAQAQALEPRFGRAVPVQGMLYHYQSLCQTCL